MSDPDWIVWTPLAPSALRRRLLRFAVGATVAVLAATAVAAWQSPDALRLSVFYVAGGAFLWAFVRSRRQPAAVELRLAASGEVWVRASAQAEPRPMRGGFASRVLVVLVGAAGRVVVWADALPPADYRRLAALLRWSGPPPKSGAAPR